MRKYIILSLFLSLLLLLFTACGDVPQASTDCDKNEISNNGETVKIIEDYEFSVMRSEYVDMNYIRRPNGYGVLEDERKFKGVFKSTEDVESFFSETDIPMYDEFRLFAESLSDEYFAHNLIIFDSVLNYGMTDIQYETKFQDNGSGDINIEVKVIPSSPTSLNTKWDGMRYFIFEANKEKYGERSFLFQYVNSYRSSAREFFTPTASCTQIGNSSFKYFELGFDSDVPDVYPLALEAFLYKITTYEEFEELIDSYLKDHPACDDVKEQYGYTEEYFASGKGLCVVVTGESCFTPYEENVTPKYSVDLKDGNLTINADFDKYLIHHSADPFYCLSFNMFEIDTEALNSARSIEANIIRYRYILA